MSFAKWRGATGIGVAPDATTASAAEIYPLMEDAGIDGVPIVARSVNNHTREQLSIVPYGKEYSWHYDNVRPTTEDFGLFWYLALGADSWLTNVHTITSKDDAYGGFACVRVDRGMSLGTGPTEVLVGARVNSISLEASMRDFVTMTIQGRGCDLATDEVALTPVLATGADKARLGWTHLQDASGFFKIGYPGTPSADTAIQGVKIDWSTDLAEGGVDLGSNQPSDLVGHLHNLTFEIMREFTGAGALADYNAWKNETAVGIDVQFYVSATSIARIQIPRARVTGSVAQSIGASNEVVKGTLQCEATTNDGANELVTVTVTDNHGSSHAP